MVYGAIDLHTRFSQIRILDETGVVRCDRRVLTTRERLVAAFADHGPIQILLEAGAGSEWGAEALEEAGDRGIVAEPNFGAGGGGAGRDAEDSRRRGAGV